MEHTDDRTRAEIDLCAHCARPSQSGIRLDDGGVRRRFCCAGCRTVYLLMRSVVEEAK